MTEDSPDALLEQLGALQRRRDRAREPWEALARGETSTAQTVQTQVAEGVDPRAVDELVGALEPRPQDRDWTSIAEEALSHGSAAPSGNEADRGEASRSSNVVWLVAGAALLAAALAALWFAQPKTPAAETIPSYTIVVRNEVVRPDRSVDPVETAVYRPSSDVSWIVRPETSISGPLEVSIVARTGDAVHLFTPPDAAVEISASGVVALRGTFSELVPVPPGVWTLQVAIGRRTPDDTAGLRDGGPWVLTDPVVVELRAALDRP